MAFRTPRGYEVNRPQYQELTEGVRPTAQAIPLEAWTGLPPVRVDDLHDDPIVLDPGTVVGIASGGQASGKLFPAHNVSGQGTITLQFTSTDTKWGLQGQDITATSIALTAGPVLPLGMIYQPVYSFQLQNQWTNYKRNDNVGFVTDYMVQIPAITDHERALSPGDLVMVDQTTTEYGRAAEITAATGPLGRLQKWDNTAANMKFVVGRVVNKLLFAQGTASTTLDTDISNSNVSLHPDGIAEFKSLDKVQTVPGLSLAGSGTKGIPAWLQKAISDAAGDFFALTILVRL